VFIEEPDLTMLADGRKLPHVYEQKPPRLCLYMPRTCEWTSSARIDETIVPWTALWLFYFEEWLASGNWKGGGEHLRQPKARVTRAAAAPRRRVESIAPSDSAHTLSQVDAQ
jgi:hypothetical protein